MSPVSSIARALLLFAVLPGEAGAWTSALTLEHRAFDHRGGVADTVLHLPDRFGGAPPLHVVVVLHGWSCCAASFVGSRGCGPDDPAPRGWELGRHHDAAGTDTVLLAPQLAILARDSRPGRFARPGFFRDWLAEVVTGPLARRLARPLGLGSIGSITLVAHSAGYQTALAILEAGAIEVRHVVLLDALYSGTERFAAWLAAARPAAPRRLVSIHTAVRGTTRGSNELAARVRARLGAGAVTRLARAPLGDAIARHPLVVHASPYGHGLVPARHLADVLAGLGLPRRAAD